MNDQFNARSKEASSAQSTNDSLVQYVGQCDSTIQKYINQ